MSHASGSVALVKRVRGAQWYARYRLPDGRKAQKRLGPAWTERGRPVAGHLTKKMAEARLREILTDAERGQYVVRTGATFADAAAEWLRYVEHDRKRRPSTLAGYRSVLGHDLLPAFGHLPLEGVTVAVIDAYRRRLVAEGRLSARTINKHLVELHAILKRAQRAYGLRTNAAAAVERQPLKRSGDFNVIEPNEVELLASAGDQDAALYVVAAFTGLRLGELRALRWVDIDFAKRLVHVRRSFTQRQIGTPKSGKVRSVPLVDRAARALDELSRREYFTDEDDLVFVNTVGNPLDDARLRRRFYAALEEAGLKRMRLHDLRHTFGTLAVQAFPLSDVKAFMGHADIATTMVYVHHVPQHDAADRLGRLLDADRVANHVANRPIS